MPQKYDHRRPPASCKDGGISVVRDALSRLKAPRDEFAMALGYKTSSSAGLTWRGISPLDAEKLIRIEQAFGIPREKVRPDLFAGYHRRRGPVVWHPMSEDRGWSKVIRAAGGHGIAFKVLAPRLGIVENAVRGRSYLDIEWLNKVEHWLGLSRHVLRPDLYSGFVRDIPPRTRLPEITEEIERLRKEAAKRAA